MNLFSFKSATFSNCREYRYTLWRWWDEEKPYAMFIGLNPSTADETNDDPTIRRCINFSKRWGYGGLCMANLFALRATDPQEMLKHPLPAGAENDKWIHSLAANAGIVVAAWGVHGKHLNRDEDVVANIDKLYCLKKTKGGFPGHPLYIKSDTEPIIYELGSE